MVNITEDEFKAYENYKGNNDELINVLSKEKIIEITKDYAFWKQIYGRKK